MNGGQSECCELFDPSKFEMLLIAKYWHRELTRIKSVYADTSSTGSAEWRIAIYAERRLERIRHHLGDEILDEALAEVDAEFASTQFSPRSNNEFNTKPSPLSNPVPVPDD